MTDVPIKESQEMSPTFLIRRPTITLAFVLMINDIILFRPVPPWRESKEEDRLEVLYYLRDKVKAEDIDQEVARVADLLGGTPVLAFSNSRFNEDDSDDFRDQTIGFTLRIRDNLVQAEVAPEITAVQMSQQVTTAFIRHQPLEILTPVGVKMISAQIVYTISEVPQTITLYPSEAKPKICVE